MRTILLVLSRGDGLGEYEREQSHGTGEAGEVTKMFSLVPLSV